MNDGKRVRSNFRVEFHIRIFVCACGFVPFKKTICQRRLLYDCLPFYLAGFDEALQQYVIGSNNFARTVLRCAPSRRYFAFSVSALRADCMASKRGLPGETDSALQLQISAFFNAPED